MRVFLLRLGSSRSRCRINSDALSPHGNCPVIWSQLLQAAFGSNSWRNRRLASAQSLATNSARGYGILHHLGWNPSMKKWWMTTIGLKVKIFYFLKIILMTRFFKSSLKKKMIKSWIRNWLRLFLTRSRTHAQALNLKKNPMPMKTIKKTTLLLQIKTRSWNIS